MDNINFLSNFNHYEIYFILYLILINFISFSVFGLDKYKARKKKNRISEANLIFLSLIGGGLGALFAMLIFKHKSSKKLFYLGIPLITLLNKVLELFILNSIK